MLGVSAELAGSDRELEHTCLIVHVRKKAEECEAGRATGKPKFFGPLSDSIKSVCHYLCPCVPRERETAREIESERER